MMDISEAFENFRAGNLKLAGDICGEILKGQPHNVSALYLLGTIFKHTADAYSKQRQFEEAESFYDKAISFYQAVLQIDQHFADTCDNLLFAYKEKNDLVFRRNRDIIHCIGDSHVSFFSGKDAIHPLWPLHVGERMPFKTYRLGPSLAYNLCELNTTTRGREFLLMLLGLLPRQSNILLVYGEIDVRSHIGKQAFIQKRQEKELTEECADRYFRVIMEIKKMGFNVGVWGVHPSNDLDSSPENPYPAYGTCEQRNVITRLFNNCMDTLCMNNDIIFVSIFEDLIDPQLRPNEEYYFDKIHLSQRAFPLALSKIKAAYGIT